MIRSFTKEGVMPGGYNEKIIEHFKNPKNVGELVDADVKATEGSPACGDQVTLYLKINESDKRITDVRFQSYGCASNIATGSIITELAKGKTLDEAKAITWQDADKELGGLPKVKVHCAVLAVDALKTAIERYEIKHGLATALPKLDRDYVMKKMRHVINPVAGADIVRTNMVRDISVDHGVVTITLDLDERHQFANNISSEINERLEGLPDLKEVRIVFAPAL
jgi:nitrogen fixation protein NifU and related proteins